MRNLLETLPKAQSITEISLEGLNEEQKTIATQIVEGKCPKLSLPDSKEYKVNLELYQTLYPYLALAYSFENNGVVAEHTMKLACMFGSIEEALKYLIAYNDRNKTNSQFVHDACLFQLPDPSPEYFKQWRILAKTKLLDDQFRKLLAISETIDTKIESDKKEQKKLELEVYDRHYKKILQDDESKWDKLIVTIFGEKGDLNQNRYKLFIEYLDREISKRKQFCDHYAAGQKIPRKKYRPLNELYLQELDELYSDRAIMRLRKPISQYSMHDFQDVYERVLSTDPARRMFLSNGIDRKYYTIFTELDCKKGGSNIPDIKVFDCGDGFYLKKLDVRNPEEAALAACLGKLTDCCQSLSGEVGQSCVIHGLTHPDSGFYVLFERNPEDPKKDIVYGQTWVNRTASGGLVFDSIESAQGMKDENASAIVKKAYRSLAAELIKQTDVPWVHCGMSSGISYKVGILSNYQFSAESPKDYQGYLDSNRQLLLADQRYLGNFDEKNNLVIDENAVRPEFTEKKEISEKIHFTIAYLLKNEQDLQTFLSCVPQKNRTSIDEYIAAQKELGEQCKKYTKNPWKEKTNVLEFITNNLSRIDFNLEDMGKLLVEAATNDHACLVKIMLESKASINIRNKYEQPLIIHAIDTHSYDTIKLLLNIKVSPDTKYGTDSLLIRASIHYSTSIVDLLLEHKASHSIQNSLGQTALMSAVSWGRTNNVEALLKANASIDIQDIYGKTALVLAAEKGDTYVVKALVEAKAKVDIKDTTGNTALSLAKNDEIRKLLKNAMENSNAVSTAGLFSSTTKTDTDVTTAKDQQDQEVNRVSPKQYL